MYPSPRNLHVISPPLYTLTTHPFGTYPYPGLHYPHHPLTFHPTPITLSLGTPKPDEVHPPYTPHMPTRRNGSPRIYRRKLDSKNSGEPVAALVTVFVVLTLVSEGRRCW